MESTLDASVVTSLIRQRLAAVSRELIRDALRGQKELPHALDDLFSVLASLIIEAADAETRSQTVVTAIARVGLTSSLAVLFVDEARAAKCADVDLYDAAYEALAANSFFARLGFQKATGQFGTNCSSVHQRMVGLLGIWSTLPTAAEYAEFEASVEAWKAACISKPPAVPTTIGELRERVDELRLNVDSDSCAVAGRRMASIAQAQFAPILKSTGQREAALQEFKSLIDDAAKVSASLSALFPGLQELLPSLVRAVAQNKQLGRGDVVVLVRSLVSAFKSLALGSTPQQCTALPGFCGPLDVVNQVLLAFVDALPAAIKESNEGSLGIRIDAPSLATAMVSSVVDQKRPGFYIRATVGTGLALPIKLPDDGSATAGDTLASIHEELGVGWRFAINKQLLFGFHAATSGLLYKLEINGAARDSWALLFGASLNVYRLLDISVNWARFWSTIPVGGDRHHAPFNAVLFSLQIPIGDYLSELANQHEVTQDPGK